MGFRFLSWDQGAGYARGINLLKSVCRSYFEEIVDFTIINTPVFFVMENEGIILLKSSKEEEESIINI